MGCYIKYVNYQMVTLLFMDKMMMILIELYVGMDLAVLVLVDLECCLSWMTYEGDGC